MILIFFLTNSKISIETNLWADCWVFQEKDFFCFEKWSIFKWFRRMLALEAKSLWINSWKQNVDKLLLTAVFGDKCTRPVHGDTLNLITVQKIARQCITIQNYSIVFFGVALYTFQRCHFIEKKFREEKTKKRFYLGQLAQTCEPTPGLFGCLGHLPWIYQKFSKKRCQICHKNSDL